MSEIGYSQQVLFFDGPGCPVNGEMLGVGPGTSDVVCSGRGQCINNRCICNSGWVGASDYYSLEGIDCQNPRIFEQILWALVGLAWVKLMYDNWYVLKYQYSQYNSKVESFKNKGRRGDFIASDVDKWPLQYLALCFFIGCPSVIITALLKTITNRVGGVDPLVTFFICFGPTFIFLISSKCEVQFIQALLNPFLKAEAAKKFIRNFQVSYYLTSVIYAIAVFIVPFLPIGMPQMFNGKDPNPRGMLVIAKNLVLIFYLIAIAFIYKVTTNEAEKILKDYEKSDRATNVVNNIISKLNEEHKASFSKVIVGIILYGIFCIPHIWGYAMYPDAFLLIISTGKGNVIYWYMPAGKTQMANNKITETNNTTVVDTSSNKVISARVVALPGSELPTDAPTQRTVSIDVRVQATSENE